jgi:hypothetical protein
MELGSSFLFLQEQIKDISIIHLPPLDAALLQMQSMQMHHQMLLSQAQRGGGQSPMGQGVDQSFQMHPQAIAMQTKMHQQPMMLGIRHDCIERPSYDAHCSKEPRCQGRLTQRWSR